MTAAHVRLRLLEEDAAERSLEVPGGRVFAYSARCPGKPRPNEDAAAVLQLGERVVLLVADGLGGQPDAEQASGIAVRALEEGLAGSVDGRAGLRDQVLSALDEANRRILELGVGAGTTVALAELDGPLVRAYHVGDSTVMVVSRRGEVQLHTIPHSPIGYALAAGLLDEEQALRHPDRHIIANMIGSAEMRVEVGSPLELGEGDTLLLASDGVTDNLRVAELVELVRGGTLERAGRALVEACGERMGEAGPGAAAPGKPDDLTCLLYRFSSES